MSYLQEPKSFRVERDINGLYSPVNQTYGADGEIVENKYYKNPQGPKWHSNAQKNYNPNDIRLISKDGTIVNGYQNSIIRPLDSVHLPREYRRDNFKKLCDYPDYAGANKQIWCSEENAINYFAMRPIIEPDKYNSLLKKMFGIIVKNSTGTSQKNIDLKTQPVWEAISCDNSSEQILKWIMKEVAKAVSQMPEFQKNGPYGAEQFHYTDQSVYQFKDSVRSFYKIIFNLYNALRSVSTLVEATVQIIGSGSMQEKLILTSLNFVNEKEWSNDISVDGIRGNNLSNESGVNEQINLEATGIPNPIDVSWNYQNTLLKQEFNPFGFYDPANNVKVVVDMSQNLKNQVNRFAQQSNSYLMPVGKTQFSGEINQSGTVENSKRLIQAPNMYANTMLNNSTVTWIQNEKNIKPYAFIDR